MARYTVSQIARRTGLTVRTLHHYEAKGLLRPPAALQAYASQAIALLAD